MSHHARQHNPPTTSGRQTTTSQSTTSKTHSSSARCGTYIVRCNDAHSCQSTEYRPNPNKQDRDQRIENDPFPGDGPVLVREPRTRNTYAYHEPDSNNTPLCPASANQSFVTLTRREAHEHRLAPCQRCQHIRKTREQEADE